MDKIKLTQITHLMAQIKPLVCDGFISCTVNAKGMGETYVHMSDWLFLELFDRYETTPFYDFADELNTEINGIKVFCLVDKDEHAD